MGKTSAMGLLLLLVAFDSHAGEKAHLVIHRFFGFVDSF